MIKRGFPISMHYRHPITENCRDIEMGALKVGFRVYIYAHSLHDLYAWHCVGVTQTFSGNSAVSQGSGVVGGRRAGYLWGGVVGGRGLWSDGSVFDLYMDK